MREEARLLTNLGLYKYELGYVGIADLRGLLAFGSVLVGSLEKRYFSSLWKIRMNRGG
jgi:hypothetical protein